MPQTQDTDDNVEPVDDFAPLTADMHLSVAECTAPVIDGPIATDHRSIWPLSPGRMVAVVAALLATAIRGPAVADPTTGVNGADFGARRRQGTPRHRRAEDEAAAFCRWMFDLLGAEPQDDFTDVFPGSGGVMRAWQAFRRNRGEQQGMSARSRISAWS